MATPVNPTVKWTPYFEPVGWKNVFNCDYVTIGWLVIDKLFFFVVAILNCQTWRPR